MVINCPCHSIKLKLTMHNKVLQVDENARNSTRVNGTLSVLGVLLDISKTVGGDMLRASMLYPVFYIDGQA